MSDTKENQGAPMETKEKKNIIDRDEEFMNNKLLGYFKIKPEQKEILDDDERQEDDDDKDGNIGDVIDDIVHDSNEKPHHHLARRRRDDEVIETEIINNMETGQEDIEGQTVAFPYERTMMMKKKKDQQEQEFINSIGVIIPCHKSANVIQDTLKMFCIMVLNQNMLLLWIMVILNNLLMIH